MMSVAGHWNQQFAKMVIEETLLIKGGGKSEGKSLKWHTTCEKEKGVIYSSNSSRL